MTRLIIATELLAVTTAGGLGQVVERTMVPQSGELTSSQAWSIGAKQCAKLIGRPLSVKGVNLQLTKSRGTRAWSAWMPAERSAFTIKSKTGELICYSNSGRLEDQFKRKGRTGKLRFATRAEWANHLLGIARRAGLSPGLRVSNLKIVRDGERKDANTGGSVNALIVDARGRQIAAIVCDPQDGELLVYADWRR